MPLTPQDNDPAWELQLLHYRPELLGRLQELLTRVATYLPRGLAQFLMETPSPGTVILPLEGTVMFADIDGFTAMSERFSQAASQTGAEELTDLVNRFLTILITTTARYGGDLQKFNGDAGLLLFTGEEHALRAVAAALDVQQAMAEQLGQVETSLGSFPLRVAIGLSSGQLVGLGLGDQNRREWILSGAPLHRMGLAQGAAPPGKVVVDVSTGETCADSLQSRALNDGLYLVEKLRQLPKLCAVPPLSPPPRLDKPAYLSWLLSHLDTLTPYLGTGVLERLTMATTPDQFYLWSEHRSVTVLMLALTGFSDPGACSENPQQLRAAVRELNQAFIQARDIIQRYDGVLDKIGIGPQGAYLMVLFGAPTAHEDDPLRAVLAAREVQDAFEAPPRIGINSGFVFAGDVGSAERREYTVMGDEVNLAYRLMSGCRPGEIWLGPHTAQHPTITRRVSCAALPPQKFKGKHDLITPFAVRELHPLFSEAETEELPLIGREVELQQALTVLQELPENHPRIIVLHGAAGAGKSRLAREITTLAREKGFRIHQGTAPSYGAHLPYAAWRNPLRSLAELDSVPPSQQSQAFQAYLARYNLAAWASLLAPLAGLDLPPSPEVASLSPEVRERQRQAVLRSLWGQAARQQPRLLLLENAHWMPPASLELLDGFIREMPNVPLLLLITCRDEGGFQEHWGARPELILSALEPLSRKATIQLARRLAHTSQLPRAVERWLVKRGGGIPLFTIEALRTLIASGVLSEQDGEWQLTQPLEDTPLPDTIYDILQSRIDQLEPPSRHLMRAATVVGETMTMPMLVTGYGEETRPAVKRRLPDLVPLGLVCGDPACETLVFHQPLVREVAYRGLPHRIRRLIHRRLVEFLDSQREQATSNWLPLLAHHALEGQTWEVAIRANLALGQHALHNYLTTQAVQAFQNVLQAADAGQLPAHSARFEAHHLLGETLTILGQYEKALEHLGAARKLLPSAPTTQDESKQLADIEYHSASVLESQGHYPEAFAAVNRGLALPGVEDTLEGARLYLMGAGLYHRLGQATSSESYANKSIKLSTFFSTNESHKIQARALYLLAFLASQRGEAQEALQLGQQSLQMYKTLADLLGEMDAHNQLSLINLAVGNWPAAVVHGKQALSIAQRIRHTAGEAKAAANLGEIYRYQGRWQEARHSYTLALKIASEQGITYGVALMKHNLAILSLEEGQLDDAQRQLDEAEHLLHEIGSETILPELYRHRGLLALLQKQPERALEWASRSLQKAANQGARQEVGRTQRLLAEIRLALRQCRQAEDALHRAAATAQATEDRYGVAQALLTEARFQHHCGTPGRALAALQQASEQFETLGATKDIQVAQSLLEQWQMTGGDMKI